MNVTKMPAKAETKKSPYSSVPKFVVTTMKEVRSWDGKTILSYVGPTNFHTSESGAETAAKALAKQLAARTDGVYRVAYGELTGVLSTPAIEVTAQSL